MPQRASEVKRCRGESSNKTAEWELVRYLVGEFKTQVAKVDNGPCLQEKVHSEDALDLKAVVHAADFDLKISDLPLADALLPYAASEYRFDPADTSDSIQNVGRLWRDADPGDLVGGQYRGCRAGVQQHIGDFELCASVYDRYLGER
jgi:hypothetical protein